MSHQRKAFTLSELLIALSIIAVLTSALAFAIRGAQERAREYRTESQLEKIERILQSQLLEFVNQRSVVQLPNVGNRAGDLGPHPGTIGATGGNTNRISLGEGLFTRTRRFREEALRVNLLSHFPYRHNHLTYDNSGMQIVDGLPCDSNGIPVVPYLTTDYAVTNAGGSPVPDSAKWYGSVPSWLAQFRSKLYVSAGVPVANGTGQTPIVLPLNEADARTNASEMLYQVLLRTWVDGQPATTLFRDAEFGDTDGDGIREVLDAWGNPVGYRLQIRVASGTNPSVMHWVDLTDYSLWMNQYSDLLGNTYDAADLSPDSMSVGRARVVAYSSSIEDSRPVTAFNAW